MANITRKTTSQFQLLVYTQKENVLLGIFFCYGWWIKRIFLHLKQCVVWCVILVIMCPFNIEHVVNLEWYHMIRIMGQKQWITHVWKLHNQELSKWTIDLQHTKKRNYPSSYAITKFSSSSKPYHKYDPTQHAFLEDLTMYITMYLGGIFKIVHDLNLVTYGLFNWHYLFIVPYFVHLSTLSIGYQFVGVSIVLYTCKQIFCNGSLDIVKGFFGKWRRL
jgi:hypothetical protein